MKTTMTTAEKIARYAAEHARDCGGDQVNALVRALREMDDEPGEVAAACDCSVADVQTWIDAARRVPNAAVDQLRAGAAAAGDKEQVRLCELALAGDASAHAECIRVIMETRAEDAVR